MIFNKYKIWYPLVIKSNELLNPWDLNVKKIRMRRLWHKKIEKKTNKIIFMASNSYKFLMLATHVQFATTMYILIFVTFLDHKLHLLIIFRFKFYWFSSLFFLPSKGYNASFLLNSQIFFYLIEAQTKTKIFKNWM